MQQANKSPAQAKAKKTLGPKTPPPPESSVSLSAPEKKRGRELSAYMCQDGRLRRASRR